MLKFDFIREAHKASQVHECELMTAWKDKLWIFIFNTPTFYIRSIYLGGIKNGKN